MSQQNFRRLIGGRLPVRPLPPTILLCAVAAQCGVVFTAENSPVTAAATDPRARSHRARTVLHPLCHAPALRWLRKIAAAEGIDRARSARIVSTLNRRRACRFEVCFQIRLTPSSSSRPSLARFLTTGPCGCPSEATPRAAVVSGLFQ